MLIKKLLFFVLSFFIFLVSASPALAKGEFLSSYNVTYDVSENGETFVTEDITLKNQTDKFYPSSFSLTIAATNITDLEAYDTDSVLETKLDNQGKKSLITVKFTKQFSGKGKEYKWTLKFKSKDFAQKTGKIWQVTVPRINQVEEVEGYNLNLLVPISFGEPTVLIPDPRRQIENAGKLQLTYNKDNLKDLGVLAYFGDNQLLEFKLNYNLENTTILPKEEAITLPPDTQYQQVLIENINPKPENVTFDEEGNVLAMFRLERKQQLNIEVTGLAKLQATPQKNLVLSDEQKKLFTGQDRFWETQNALILNRLAEIVPDQNLGVKEKMEKLHRYVSSNFQFDSTRINEQNFDRLGALTSLANPEKLLSAEFTDLLVTFARTAGISSRRVIGVGIRENPDIRPLSYQGTKLHSWVEYFDDKSGWVAVDPTWENTTGGVDYFTKPDLSHFAIARHGLTSTGRTLPTEAEINLVERDFTPKKDLKLVIEGSSELYASFPSRVKVKIQNSGNSAYPRSEINLAASTLEFIGKDQKSAGQVVFNIPEIPPSGILEFEYGLKTGPISSSYSDQLSLTVGSFRVVKNVTVKPFYASTPLIFAVSAAVLLILAVYILVLGLHLRISESGITFTPPAPRKHKKK